MYRPGPAGKDWTVWMLLRRTKSILRLSATVFSVLFGLQEPRGSCCCYCCCPHRKGRWRGWKGSSQTWLPLDIFIITATSSETIIGTAHPDQKKEGQGAELWEKMSFNERMACKNIYLRCTLQNSGFSPALLSTLNRHKWTKQMLQKLRNSEFWILNSPKLDSIETLVKTNLCLMPQFVTVAFCWSPRPKP